jgi:hypothetical protein
MDLIDGRDGDAGLAEEVTFHNPLQDNPFTQTVYLAKKQAVPRWAAPAS